MCITVNTAELTKTKILSIPVGNGNNFLAYSNSVKNLSGKPNAMIIPIPGKTKKEWFYDTTEYNDFLNEIVQKSRLQEDYYGIISRGISKSLSKSLEEFKVGNYNVVIADSIQELNNFIDSMDINKRPELNSSLVDFFANQYPNFSYALCMFDSNKTIDAQPIAFEYTPFLKDSVYFPTMDAHDGNPPNLKELVSTDHTFIYEHTGTQPENLYQKSIELNSSVPAFLKNRKYRFFESNSNKEINGDTFMSVQDILETPFEKTPIVKRG